MAGHAGLPLHELKEEFGTMIDYTQLEESDAERAIVEPVTVSGRFHIFCGCCFDWDLPICCVFLS
eukprot:COSAG01_NODE_14968_length_1390_cov_2.336174_1_plen_65_part_00